MTSFDSPRLEDIDLDLEDTHTNKLDTQTAFFTNNNKSFGETPSYEYVYSTNTSTNHKKHDRTYSPVYHQQPKNIHIPYFQQCLPLLIKLKNSLLMIPSIFIIGIICFIIYCTLFLALPFRYLQARDSGEVFKQLATLFLALCFCIFSTLTFTSFVRCVFTSSAVKDNPPKTYNISEIICRTCSRCSQLKPQRAHHCSVCGTCILKMDHHCPWVSNCVGYFNYKYFVLFIWSATIACHISSMICLSELYQIVGHYGHSVKTYSGPHSGWMMVNSLLSLAFGVTLTCFSVFHTILVFQGSTTIEFGGEQAFKFSWKRNFYSVFGENRWYWFLPVPTMQGDGYEYCSNRNLLENDDDDESDEESCQSSETDIEDHF